MINNGAIIFPGQGAQFVGMGKDLAEIYPACGELLDVANDVLGYDLAHLCFEGPPEKLTRSDYAQPAIFVISAVCFTALLQERPDTKFRMAAGLSSGEWAALYTAGVVSFEDTLNILESRGRFMQEACELNSGGMLSIIGLARPALDDIAEQAGVEIANLNSPAQTVLSGTIDGIETAEKLAREAGAKRAIRLDVAGAFHSSLMKPAAQRFQEFLVDISFSVPDIPVVSNVTARLHSGPDDIKQHMVEQITSSVRWVESVEVMSSSGIEEFVECGPGKVLTGLVKRIDKKAALHNIQDHSSLSAILGM